MSPKMPAVRIVHGSEFIAQVLWTRNIWLAGRLGSGKTLLSICLASEFLKLGLVDHVWTNFPVRVDMFPPPEDGILRRSLIIFDEAHEVLDARTFMSNSKDYGSYARKLDTIWLYPSVHSVDKRLRAVMVQRAFRFDLLPFNAWFYRWQLSIGSEQGSGWFILVNPESVFGLYDHRYIPFGDGGIQDAWARTMEWSKMHQGGASWNPLSASPGWGGVTSG